MNWALCIERNLSTTPIVLLPKKEKSLILIDITGAPITTSKTCNNSRGKIIDKGIAIEFVEPMWKIMKGDTLLEERHVYGFKATHDVTHSNYFLVADDIGGCQYQKGDGFIGGTRLLCKREIVPKKVTSN